MQQRTIFSIILGVGILSISLFLLNTWLNKNNEGMFLTQDTYVGTVTWYEDATTPPVPSEFKKSSPLHQVASNESNTTTITSNALTNDVLDIITAGGKENTTPLEPEIYDATTGQFVKAPTVQPLPTNTQQIQPVEQPTVVPKVVQEKPSPSKQPVPPIKPAIVASKQPTTATQTSIKRIFLTKDTKRPLRIEASQPITYSSFYLSSPERIVIDINGKLDIQSIEKTITKHVFIKDIRIAYNQNNTRIVVDLLKKPKQWAVMHGQRKSTIDVSVQ